MTESHKRSVAKGISWRLGGTLCTVVIAWLLTGSARAGVAIGVVDFIIKVVMYYIHERIWQRVGWGRTDGMIEIGGGI